eukprot:CAMPEP_0194331718 /NCGR_PEP_ID=MMETSP0171-20130528/56611_1 /TAXON_ID=218684 /ORGANISM="Corethron pennatum, Strain L29A3" /LENGTH=297 /DNA_ID=CAMNT_0039093311 /DNA_START=619 /DNA_END=1509 /DNA_ORIENTATION=-
MESTPEQVAESCAVVKVLAAVLERLIGVNSSIQNVNPGAVTKFHALKPPSIAVLAYLERIHKYASCSTECFILALIYIDRLIQRNNFLLSELNVHRVVITSIMLAAKFFDDQYYNNAYYAKVGGVLVSEMNSLEVEFLFRLNFSLHVTPDVFGKYHAELVAHAVSTSPVASPLILPISGAPLTQSVHPTVSSPVEVTPESKSEETPTGYNQQNYDFNLAPSNALIEIMAYAKMIGNLSLSIPLTAKTVIKVVVYLLSMLRITITSPEVLHARSLAVGYRDLFTKVVMKYFLNCKVVA